MLVLLFTLDGCSKDSFTLEGTLTVKVGRHTETVIVSVYPYDTNWLQGAYGNRELERAELADKEMSVTFSLNAGNYVVSSSGEGPGFKVVQVRAGKEVVLDYPKDWNYQAQS